MMTMEQVKWVMAQTFPDHQEYHLGKKLGQGGCGIVYELLGTPQPAVVKLVEVSPAAPELKLNAEQQKRLLQEEMRFAERERALLKRFSAERAFPTLFDSRVYMPACGNCRVYIYVEEKLLPLEAWRIPGEELAIRVGAAASSALSALEKQHIAYRDFKPGNCMLRQKKQGDFEVVVVDYGAAKEKLESGPDTVIGSKGYIAPELYYKHRLVIGKTDVYSIGVTLAELASGGAPLYTLEDRDEQQELARQIQTVKEKKPALGVLVSKMVRVNPYLRPSLTSCAKQLTALLPPDPGRDPEIVRNIARRALSSWQRGDLPEARKIAKDLPETARQKHLLGVLLAESTSDRMTNLRMAARLASPAGMYYLGCALLTGHGVKQDKGLALKDIELAARSGFVPAQQLLKALERGEVVVPSDGYKWLLKEIAE